MPVRQNIECITRHTHRKAQLTEVRAHCRIHMETSHLMSIAIVK